MKRYISPQARVIALLAAPLMDGTNIEVDPDKEAEDDGWTRRFDWQEPADKDGFFY